MNAPVICRISQLIVLGIPFCMNVSFAKDVGKQAYDTTCKACHARGAMGAPKLGDKAAWAERSKLGFDVLADHAINGFKGKAGIMPPKGGNSTLSDDDVKAAVKYMLDSVM